MTLSFDIDPVNRRHDWLDRRAQDVTASHAGALLRVHPYVTLMQLWAIKSLRVGLDQDEELSPPMERGVLLEPVAAELLRRRHPRWLIEYPVHKYFRDPATRLGATPDLFARDPMRPGRGCIQIKSVERGIFKRDWQGGDRKAEPVAPTYISVQALIDATLSGSTWAAVAPLVVSYGLEMPLIEIPLHPPLMARLGQLSLEFWRLVETGMPPAADYERDGDALAEMFEADPDAPVKDLSAVKGLTKLLDDREALSLARRGAKDRWDAIKAQLLFTLGNASIGIAADGRRIRATTVRKDAYRVEAQSYVDVRVLKPSERWRAKKLGESNGPF